MSFYLSNSDTRPTGYEAIEFLDDPDLLPNSLSDRAVVAEPSIGGPSRNRRATEPTRVQRLRARMHRPTRRRRSSS